MTPTPAPRIAVGQRFVLPSGRPAQVTGSDAEGLTLRYQDAQDTGAVTLRPDFLQTYGQTA